MLRTTAELALEEHATRDPYSLGTWLAYTKYLSEHGAAGVLFCVYERSVAALPGSYKLWRAYSHAFRAHAKTFHPAHAARTAALQVSSRAARALRVSPVLWVEYARHAADEGRWTEMRKAANDALRALPVLQHGMVWDMLFEVLAEAERIPPKLEVLFLRRYAKLRPGNGRERLYRCLLRARLWDDAVSELCNALADLEWQPEGKFTREQLWMELSRVAAKHPQEVVSTDVPTLLRGAIKGAKTDIGELWVVFGEYFIRKGLFEDARNVYEEAVTSVTAVRDFAVVFDAFAKFEESLVSAAIEDVETIKDEMKDDSANKALAQELQEATEMVELLISRLEHLTNRRAMLLSDVWLRQNPHNVHEWHKRARMFKQAKDAPNVVDTYTKSVQTVNPWRATNGRPHTLWLAFARYYEDAKDFSSAIQVLEKAVSDPEQFRSSEDLAAVWCEYAEMELRRNSLKGARDVLVRAIQEPDKKKREEASKKQGIVPSNMAAVIGAGAVNKMITHEYDSSSPAWNAFKSMRVWHFLIDLSQSISMPEEVISIHHQMFQLRIASPQTVLSGAAYLESNRLFEQAFRLYDKGSSAISWPAALEIWVVYLTKFVKRFGAQKLERARDLFEEAIRSAPSKKKGGHEYAHPQLRLLYIMYADMEERYSLARHALKVLGRAVKAVQETDRADMYRLYIVKTATLFGVTKTRPIYEDAMTTLAKTEEVLEMAMRYADMEMRVGEMDRARGVYRHACQIADPRRRGFYEVFWKAWNDFELRHGNEDTFRDMLREKRGVQLNFKGVILEADMMVDGMDGRKRGIRYMVPEVVVAAGDGVSRQETEKEVEPELKSIGSVETDQQNGLDVETDQQSSGDVENKQEKDGFVEEGEDTGSKMDSSDGKIAEESTGEREAKYSEDGKGSKEGRGLEDVENGKLRIEEKEVPEAVRRLLTVSQAVAKRTREDTVDDGTHVGQIHDIKENSADTKNKLIVTGLRVGALERIKRQKKT